MEKIKVCHIITKLELGGAQQNTLYTVAHLDKEKFISLLISGRGGIMDSEAVELKGVKVYFTSSIIRQIRPCKDVFGFFKILRILLKERPQVVHTHSSKAGILGRWAAYIARVPVILHTVHGFGFNEFQNKLERGLIILAERITAKITDKMIVVTKEDEKKGISNRIGNENQYILIRSGIDTKFYKNHKIDMASKKKELNISAADKVITTIGPFKPQKNLKDFIKVSKLVSEKVSNCIFLVIGDGRERKALEFLIYGLKLDKKVRLLGWRRDIADILSISDVFVLTSLWEGLPRTILEAMCLKVPVVANAVDGVKEIVKDGTNGLLANPFDNDKMSELILKLINEPQTARDFGIKGYENITEEFDINFMVKQQENLYLESINNKRKTSSFN